jgi:glycosyltransferase involved in cell wall biosynthesis
MVKSPLPTVLRHWNSSAKLVDVFRDIRQSSNFEAVWVDRSYFAEILRSAGFERLVVDIDDLQTRFFVRDLQHSPWYRSKPFHYVELAKLFAYERSLPRRFWRLVVCKDEDRRFFRQQKNKVFVVPNGVADYEQAPPERERLGELLYIGAMDYDPNVDAAQFFHQAILPMIREVEPEACFHVVGKNPHPSVQALQDGTSCIVHGLVADITPCYEKASVVVAPIRQGSGTRLKVLEALARGKALVATSVAAEGLDLRPGIDLEIADEPVAFARACCRLLGNPPARRQLGAAGRARVFERYRWDAVGTAAERVLTPSLP